MLNIIREKKCSYYKTYILKSSIAKYLIKLMFKASGDIYCANDK